MKKLFFFLAFLITTTAFLSAQADKIVGFWLTEEGDSQVEIYKGTDGKYYGKISWLEEPNENGKPKVDDENPDPALQNRPIMGLPLLQGFTYNREESKWEKAPFMIPITERPTIAICGSRRTIPYSRSGDMSWE